ncbi:MAG: prenyltransferase/squalene oxidase repeat-containing protein [Planctomycetota bacterium]
MRCVVVRRFLVAAVRLLLVAATTCCDAVEIKLVGRIDASLAKAGRFLVAGQSPDGAWRSETYGAFRDGPTLTPYVMSCLFYLPQAGPDAPAAYRRGVDYLAGFVDHDGRLDVGPRELLFPVYTAASASRVVVLQESGPRNEQAQEAWLAYLLRRQLNEALGWSRSDPEYGGWGFSLGVPEKPRPGELKERFFESNLAATIFGLAALRSAKVAQDDPAYRQALVFVRRCQNFSDDPSRSDSRFDDGGFFFMPEDPVQNKAGIAGVDRFGRRRFHSYGTMTADGLRALLRAGLAPEHPRVVTARAWLESNFSAEHNPGTFEPDRAVLQDATYYYWAWAVAHAFLAVRTRRIEMTEGQVDWAEELAEALISRQQADGSWINRGRACWD